MMMNGSSQDWKLMTINRYTSTIEKNSPPTRPMKESRMVWIWPRTMTCAPRGRVFALSATILSICVATLPRSVPSTEPKMSMTGWTL